MGLFSNRFGSRPELGGIRRARRVPEVALVSWGFMLHGTWEFLHSPLYTDHAEGFTYVLWTRLHCTVGDLLILLFSFWATSLVFRSRHWIGLNCAGGAPLFTGFGLGYTVWSEWYNTQVSLAWEYASTMPQLFGIGLTPLLQWLIVSPTLVVIVRKTLQRAPRQGNEGEGRDGRAGQ